MEQQMNPDAVEFAKIIDGMFDLYVKKNSNYGNSFTKLWEELGPVAGLVPLHNKLDRATNLVKGGTNNFESLEDTFIDMANYAIMNVIEMRKVQAQNTSYGNSSPDEAWVKCGEVDGVVVCGAHGPVTPVQVQHVKQILNEAAERDAEREAQAIIENGGI